MSPLEMDTREKSFLDYISLGCQPILFNGRPVWLFGKGNIGEEEVSMKYDSQERLGGNGE